MSFLDVLKEFRTLGCADQTKCALACRVFVDLQQDARVTQLEKIFDHSLDLIYLRGQRESTHINFIPILSCQELDLTKIDEIQSKLSSTSKSITLAICDPSSNILYYQMTAGLLEK